MSADSQPTSSPRTGVILGGLAVVGATLTYWLVVPGVGFGIAAIWIGVRNRKQGMKEVGAVAIALGVVALYLVPMTLFVAGEAEDWGRSCALNPSMDEHC